MKKSGRATQEWSVLLFLLVFALIFLRFCYFGFTYFPQLDDYIQLHNYSAHRTFEQVVLKMDLLTARPLAALGDFFVWGRLWNAMIAGVAVLSALFAGSAVLFQAVWRKYFGTGHLFLVLYALPPLLMEGTYWVSASNRVIPSLFFAALAIWLFQRWCSDGKASMLILFFVTQLVSFGFYEQGILLSVTGTFLVAILEFKAEHARAFCSLLTFVNAGIYFVITKSFDTGFRLLANRMKLAFPWQEGWNKVFESAGAQVGRSFVTAGWKTTARGFRRGLEVIFAQPNAVWFLALLGLCVLLFLAARKHTGETTGTPAALIVGFLLALAPITLFFILAQPAFSLRNTVFSFPGLALMADSLWGLLTRRLSIQKVLTAGLCALLAFIFSVGAVSELHDYRQTYLDDQRVAFAILQVPTVQTHKKVAVINLQSSYLPEQNFLYHEHIHGATESDWALTGLLTCVSDNPQFPFTTPIPNPEGADLSGYDLVLIYDHATGLATIKE